MLQAKTCYWFVLLVYAGLWGCQMFVCNSTHSLIVLTDSYINLYFIIEIILELFHLRVQSKIGSNGEEGSEKYKIFKRTCTYQFKRLPLLGSFMNSVFLSALSMYAAIEGIQSCFHAHHLIYEGGKSILLQHKLTYPGLLVGFAFVGILMRSVLNSVHNLRDEEAAKRNVNHRLDKPSRCDPMEANSTDTKQNSSPHDSRSSTNSLGDISLKHLSVNQNVAPVQNATGVILKSFKTHPDLDEKMGSVCISLDNSHHHSTPEASKNTNRMNRHIVSPVALFACAIVVYFITDDLVTEVTDAVLAIVVVVVVYIASYPSMNRAGRTLLQSAPMDLDLDSLSTDLKSVSPLISTVDELHVWTLTNDSDRVGSCNLLIAKNSVTNEKEITAILQAARSKFLCRGVYCTNVQPVFFMESDCSEKIGISHASSSIQ